MANEWAQFKRMDVNHCPRNRYLNSLKATLSHISPRSVIWVHLGLWHFSKFNPNAKPLPMPNLFFVLDLKVSNESQGGFVDTNYLVLPLKRCCCWQQLESLICLFSLSIDRELVAYLFICYCLFFCITMWNGQDSPISLDPTEKLSQSPITAVNECFSELEFYGLIL